MAETRPNILFIMVDQQRHDWLGYAGADWVKTPNLDRLAAAGRVFTHCCSNSPVCAPARIGLAAGLHPARLGAVDNRAFLPKSVPTYYQRLRDRGYRVGCVGKLDLAKPDGYNGRYGDRPVVYTWGFTHPEECEGKMHAGRGLPPHGPYTNWLNERGELEAFAADYKKRAQAGYTNEACWDSVLPAEAFEDIYIGNRAAEWIQSVPDDFPWHYFVSFVGPHDPFDPPTEYADLYRNADMPDPVEDSLDGKPNWIKARSKEPDAEKTLIARRQYCGAITAIDDGVGCMLDTLEARGFAENTFIVFSCDHGELLGDHRLWTKSAHYEGALRVPLVVSGPGIEPGYSDALIELIDINPTICDLAGVGPEEDIDAVSFAPILRGETSEHREDIISSLRNTDCIRTHEYKYIRNHNDVDELYDMENDPDELRNVISDHPAIGRDLGKRLASRLMQGGWLR